MYRDLDYKKPEKTNWALNLPIFNELRTFIMVLTILFIDNNLVVQILIFCLSSIFLMTLYGFVHPYAVMDKNKMGIITEFVILLVIDVLIRSSDPGIDVSARAYLGWSVIVILSVVLCYSQGKILIKNCRKVKLKCKKAYMKR